jgi:hypothetical protein
MLALPVRLGRLVFLLVAVAYIPVRAKYYADDSYGSTSQSSSSFEAKCIVYNDPYYERGWSGYNDLSHACKTPSSNAHGTYTSRGTCTFQFHSILNDTVKANYMSSACSDKNVIDGDQNGTMDDPIRQEVSYWPDACVGDFRRCYMIDRDEHIILPHLCRSKTSVPEGTTHISVDCTADKANQTRIAQSHFAVNAAVIAAGLVCVFCCLALFKRCFIQPCLDAWKSNRSDYRYTDLRSDPEIHGFAKHGRFDSGEGEVRMPGSDRGAIELA